MEMRKDQIQNFLKHIDRLCTRAFFSRQYLKYRNDLNATTLDKDDFALGGRWSNVLDCIDDIHPKFFNQIWERKKQLYEP
jgi:hypothetical protein